MYSDAFLARALTAPETVVNGVAHPDENPALQVQPDTVHARLDGPSTPAALCLKPTGFSPDCALAQIVPIVLQQRLCFQKSGMVTSFGP